MCALRKCRAATLVVLLSMFPSGSFGGDELTLSDLGSEMTFSRWGPPVALIKGFVSEVDMFASADERFPSTILTLEVSEWILGQGPRQVYLECAGAGAMKQSNGEYYVARGPSFQGCTVKGATGYFLLEHVRVASVLETMSPEDPDYALFFLRKSWAMPGAADERLMMQTEFGFTLSSTRTLPADELRQSDHYGQGQRVFSEVEYSIADVIRVLASSHTNFVLLDVGEE